MVFVEDIAPALRRHRQATPVALGDLRHYKTPTSVVRLSIAIHNRAYPVSLPQVIAGFLENIV